VLPLGRGEISKENSSIDSIIKQEKSNSAGNNSMESEED